MAMYSSGEWLKVEDWFPLDSRHMLWRLRYHHADRGALPTAQAGAGKARTEKIPVVLTKNSSRLNIFRQRGRCAARIQDTRTV